VVRQVFPEVSRVAGHAGPGTHRLAITLHPETLGEVRVTLVVRPGAVHVRLSADSAEAQRALAQGAPELHRLLAVAGGDASVVVREAAPGATGASAGADPRGSDGRGGEPSYPSWAAGGRGEAGGSREHRGHAGQRPPERGEPLVPSVPVRRPGPASSTVRPGRLDRLM
jgi:flagellar hook-length control protein FliK